MGYVFISYSSENLEDALTVRSLLMNRGVKVWMAPGDIPAGSSNYSGVIARAIRNSECLVLLLTNEAQNSAWVDKEVERAISYGKPVIPIALDRIALNDSFEFYLANQQIIPVRQISGENKDLMKVLDQIGKIAGADPDSRTGEEDPVDVTGMFSERRILLYSPAAGKFASARLDLERAPVCCSTDNQEAWEIFRVTVDEEGQASFRACNDRFLTVSLNEDKDLPPIRADAPESLLWEKFAIYKTSSGYALKAACNGKWVTSRIDWEENPLLASRPYPDSWEFFDIRIV